MCTVAIAIYSPVPVHDKYATVGRLSTQKWICADTSVLVVTAIALSRTTERTCICTNSSWKNPMCAVAIAIYGSVPVHYSVCYRERSGTKKWICTGTHSVCKNQCAQQQLQYTYRCLYSTQLTRISPAPVSYLNRYVCS